MNNNSPEIGHREEGEIQEGAEKQEIVEEESAENLAEKRISQVEASTKALKVEGKERMEHVNDTIHLPQEEVNEINAETQTSEKLDDISKRAEDAAREAKESIRSTAEKQPERRGKLAESIARVFNIPVEEIPFPEWWKWKKEGFDIKEKLSKIDGPFVEVAGPTEKGYSIVKLDDLDKKVFVSNITPGWTEFNDQTGESIELKGNVDFQADARELPFKDSTIGAVFCSCLGELHSSSKAVDIKHALKLRIDALKEIFRALKSEGVLVWQGGKEEDVRFAQDIGFNVDQYEVSNIADLYYTKKPVFNVVFEKGGNETRQEFE